MQFWELQKIAKEVLDSFNIPICPISISNRMTWTRGKARWQYGNHNHDRIILASYILQSEDNNLIIGVFLHELAHIITQEKHNAKFYEVSDKLRERYNIPEHDHVGLKRKPKKIDYKTAIACFKG